MVIPQQPSAKRWMPWRLGSSAWQAGRLYPQPAGEHVVSITDTFALLGACWTNLPHKAVQRCQGVANGFRGEVQNEVLYAQVTVLFDGRHDLFGAAMEWWLRLWPGTKAQADFDGDFELFQRTGGRDTGRGQQCMSSLYCMQAQWHGIMLSAWRNP